jgi:bifunctional DNase/RNase
MNHYLWMALWILFCPAAIDAAQAPALLESKIKTLILDPNTQAPVVILESVADKKLLPIWIDIAEARAIALELEQVKAPRPLTHDLFRNVLNRFAVSLERAVITDLRNNIYYALLYLKSKAQEMQVDARPSDAMALALRMNAPLFVAAHVFAKAKAVPSARRQDDAQLKLGLQTQDLTPELAAAFEVGAVKGIIVALVQAGSPAAVAGIERGDIITKANDSAIESTGELEDLLRATKAPAKLKLEIIRKGKPATLQLDLP